MRITSMRIAKKQGSAKSPTAHAFAPDFLAQQRQNLEQRLELLRQRRSAQTDEVDEDGDLIDQVSGDVAEALRLELGDLESAQERAIEAAITRHDEGTYGLCQSCSQAISEARLIALPESALCIGCQESEERNPSAATLQRRRGSHLTDADWKLLEAVN